MKRKIFLIRHGQTTGDIEDRYGGSYDDELTEKGREQLRETAKRLEGVGVAMLYTSSLMRARQSADILNEILMVPLEVLSGLQERNYGVLGGLTKAEAHERFPEPVELHQDPKNTDPEGESLNDFEKRVLDTFQTIIAKHQGMVVIVSHGGPIKTILRHLGRALPERIGDGEILEVEVS